MSNTCYLQMIPVHPVGDVEKSAAWYRDILGFNIVHINRDDDGDPTNYAVLARDGAEVHLMLASEGPALAGTGNLYLVVQGVREMHDDLRARHVTITRELQHEAWGAWAFNMKDPDGNVIIVMERKAKGTNHETREPDPYPARF